LVFNFLTINPIEPFINFEEKKKKPFFCAKHSFSLILTPEGFLFLHEAVIDKN
jgi:hypothetical protein